jgi:hypothetical protein
VFSSRRELSLEEGGAMRGSAGFGRRWAAAALAVSLSGIPIGFGQSLRFSGSLSGRIFLADGVTPRGGVVVRAANLTSSQVYESTQTDKSGRYAFANLPSGQYQVAVAAGEGLYVNPDRIPVMQGRKTLFSLALSPDSSKPSGKPEGQEPPPEPPPEPAPQEPPPPPQEPPAQEQPPQEQPPAETKPPEEKPKTPAEEAANKDKEKKKGNGTGFWRSGWGVAIGLGGGAIVLGLLADSIAGDNSSVPEPPSPTNP